MAIKPVCNYGWAQMPKRKSIQVCNHVLDTPLCCCPFWDVGQAANGWRCNRSTAANGWRLNAGHAPRQARSAPAVPATCEGACWRVLGPPSRPPQRRRPTNEPSRGKRPHRICGIAAPSCPSSFSRLGRAPQDDGRCATQATLPQRGPKPAAWCIRLADATRPASTIAAAQRLPTPQKGLPRGRCASNTPRLLSQPPWRPRLLQTRGKASEMQ